MQAKFIETKTGGLINPNRITSINNGCVRYDNGEEDVVAAMTERGKATAEDLSDPLTSTRYMAMPGTVIRGKTKDGADIYLPVIGWEIDDLSDETFVITPFCRFSLDIDAPNDVGQLLADGTIFWFGAKEQQP